MYETVCKRCGTHNDDAATFCGSCGAFLEWEGERVATDGESVLDDPVSAAPVTTVPPPPPPTGTSDPPSGWLAPGPGTSAGSSGASPPLTATPPPPPPIFGAPSGSATAPVSTPSAGTAQPLPGTAQPLPGSAKVAARQPEAMKPALPATPRPTHPTQQRPPTRRPAPGDLICGQCGEGNDANRRFCRRCGATLAEAAAVVPLPWWKRLFSRSARQAQSERTKRAKAPTLAGARPPSLGTGSRLKQARRKLKPLLVIGAIVVVILFLAVPGLRRHVTSESTRVRRVIHPKYQPIAVSAAVAGQANGCTAPSVEANSTVYWYTRALSATPQVLTITFAPSFSGDLDKIGVTPIAPASTSGPSNAASPAPSQVQIVGASTVTPSRLTLADPPKFQSFTVKAKTPRSLQVQLIASDPTTTTACAETAFIFYDKS